ncbi:putative GTPase [Scopulibacillus daqui]|uniref:GTPase n=1 Tax=Scopulibacillus daqui TaxID=1469162 RepID=A0ABS2Q320_9BACL|nr:putative GTPase [Scopulibacillus daqui]
MQLLKDNALIQSKLALLYAQAKRNGDELNAGKFLDLYKKAENNRFSISFCGHFSAGKSSLLNYIIEESILPASPIPTSGNLVRLMSGEPSANIYTNSGEVIKFSYPYDMEEIQDYCRDSENVTKIDIQVGHHLPETVELYDTPGVDSTVEAHQESTESALHLADVIIFVSDYNHVQSTVNFQFLEQIKKIGKPFYLVISQIDKHRGEELPFSQFQERVEGALSDWDLSPEGIYYISLFDKTNPDNQLEAFISKMNSLLKGDRETNQEKCHATLEFLVSEHQDYMKDILDEKLEELAINEMPAKFAIEKLQKDKEEAEKHYQALAGRETEWLNTTKESITKAIHSAILMPYETREKAKNYIESCQKDFKAGLFNSQKKRMKEQSNRLEAFYEDFAKNVQTMEWAARDVLIKACQNIPGFDESEFGEIYELSIDITKEFLTEPVKKGANTSGQYILHYADDVSDQTKKAMKKTVFQKLDCISEKIHRKFQVEAEEAKNNLDQAVDQYERMLAAYHEQERYKENIIEINRILKSSAFEEQSVSQALKMIESDDHSRRFKTIDQPVKKAAKKEAANQSESSEKHISTPHDKVNFFETDTYRKEWSSLLRDASHALASLDSFKRTVSHLQARAERIEKNAFTIALFGAFSAGKTSFANALLAEDVLPVSPNPTTAVINKIKPVTNERPHRTVEAAIKTEAVLIDDINYSLSAFGKKINQLDELHDQLKDIESQALKPKEKLHYTFLKAVINGAKHFEGKLGETLFLDLSEAHELIANEEKSCYIESVSIYYDCPFTRQGVVLVDTPGADSINARHTNVAFQYIKNADAILFVTYFNHAFSRADKEFLIQLGRVKDNFDLDKMFFIVNAIDLAQSEQEKAAVIKYVNHHLTTFGILHPRLYGISSKLGLLSQKTKNQALYKQSGLEHFMNDWSAFSVNELLKHTIQIGIHDIQKANNDIEKIIENIQLDESAKEEKKKQLKQSFANAKRIVESRTSDGPMSVLKQNMNEWFFYIKKRVLQRYLDEFNVFFNPSAFNDNQKSPKTILAEGLNECIEFLSYDIDQELRAAYIRIESLIQKLLNTYLSDVNTAVSKFGFTNNIHFEPAFKTPEYAKHLNQCDQEPLKSVFKFYKNRKHFFEKNGKEQMKDSLYKQLDTSIDELLEAGRLEISAHYLDLFNDLLEQAKNECLSEWEETISYQLQAIDNHEIDPEKFTAVHHKLESILQKNRL